MTSPQRPDQAANRSMLVAFDGSPQARRALELAAGLLTCGTVYVVTVWEPLHRSAPVRAEVPEAMAGGGHDLTGGEEADPAHAEAATVCRQGVDLAVSLGLSAEPYLVESTTTVWSAIVDAADELDAGVIVSGTRGTTGLRGLLQSSTADAVLRHAGRPVLIIPPPRD